MRSTLPNARLKLDSHPGLLLQRYVAHPADGSDNWSRAKRDIHDAARTARCELYKAAYDRWWQSLPELTAANDMQTVGRLIVGLGTENVLETGIRLHHTYGMPILPGSALKGLAAHYCDQVWGPTDTSFKRPTIAEEEAYARYLVGKGPKPKDNYHRLLFGTTDDSGSVIFHDAWLVPDSKQEPLTLDVMTPHHPRWLDGSVAPTDFDSPTPVPFLSVRGQFSLAVTWNGPQVDNRAGKWTMRVFDLLVAALGDWGIGGKTTSGYGRMSEPHPDRRRKPYSAAELGLPAAGAEIEATLLKAPKRADKPWRASIRLRTGQNLSGPIEGTPPPAPQPGKPVRLIVTQVNGQMIQFAWRPAT